MRIDQLTVEVRDGNLARVGQLRPQDLVDFTAVLRFNNVGNWKLNLPADHRLVDSLRAPGAGIIVTGPNGVIMSGPTTAAVRTQSRDDIKGAWEISGTDDSLLLQERLAYPTPASADVAAQTSEYDTRTGKTSTVMLGYVNANIGPSAPAGRKVSTLTLASDPLLGSTITTKARFDKLGELIYNLATKDGLGFDLVQSGAGLVFRVFQPTDRSATIRMDIENNQLTKSSYSYTAPGATRVIVAGQGDGNGRTFVEVSASSVETTWSRRIETFQDERSTSVTAELTLAGQATIAEKGQTIEAISVSPTDDTTMQYGVDWALGDKVSVVAGGTTISKIVTEVGILVKEDGIRIGATVGDPSAADPESTQADTTSDQEVRISNLERNSSSGGDMDASSMDVAGTITAARVRITSTADASGTSTDHGLTVGDAAAQNIKMDNNEISAFNNGAVAPLYLNPDGGTVSVGNTSGGTLQVTGNITATGTLVADNVGPITTGIITAASGWTTSAVFTKRNGIAMLNVAATRTGAALSAGNIANNTVGTLAAAYRPLAEALAGGGPNGPVTGAYISASTGGVVITAIATGIATSDQVDINATFILA